MQGTLAVTGSVEADELINTDPLALLLGMLLDQQVPMEWAFVAPSFLRDRLGDRFNAAGIATMDPDEFLVVAKGPRAIHRFPGSMAKRVQAVCAHLVEHYDGDAEAIWRDVPSGEELVGRLRALPGFGDEKSKIFTALLAKRVGVRPPGWAEAAAPFSDDTPRSVADIDSKDSFARVRAWKQEKKRQGKTKQD
jgi:uncharacterized HhH-GPD family protein